MSKFSCMVKALFMTIMMLFIAASFVLYSMTGTVVYIWQALGIAMILVSYWLVPFWDSVLTSLGSLIMTAACIADGSYIAAVVWSLLLIFSSVKLYQELHHNRA